MRDILFRALQKNPHQNPHSFPQLEGGRRRGEEHTAIISPIAFNNTSFLLKSECTPKMSSKRVSIVSTVISLCIPIELVTGYLELKEEKGEGKEGKGRTIMYSFDLRLRGYQARVISCRKPAPEEDEKDYCSQVGY